MDNHFLQPPWGLSVVARFLCHRVATAGVLLMGVLILGVRMSWANMPPPTVSVATVESREITERQTFTGRLTAVDAVALRPRVSGQIQRVHFEEGAVAQEGDVLFELDDRLFKAALGQAQAEYTRANTQYEQAQREANRGKDLLQRKVISKEEYELRVAAAAAGLAEREAASAAVEAAQLNLAFTRLTAPVTGRLGLAEITAGNWVQAGQTVLTHLVAPDRLYADFAVDERTFLEFGHSWILGETPVRVGLITNEDYPFEATLTFIDNQVNARTGTIQLRATLTASDALRPGFFARVSVPTKGPYEAVLINERAIGTDQGARYVLTLGADNVAQYTPVTLGPRYQGLRVVRSGLSAGARIIVKGLMRARPGAPVAPTFVDMQALTPLPDARTTQLGAPRP